MFKKWLLRIFLFLLFSILLIYLIPAPQHDFFKSYQKKDAAYKQLKDFMQHPVKTISVNGDEWIYFADGKGEKTLLFIHGMGGAYNLWWQQVAAFKNRYRVLTFTIPETVDSLEKAVAGIRAVLKAENVDTFYVIGTSMGGYIAQYLVDSMPRRIEKAVFSNTFPPNKIIAEKNDRTSRIIPYLPNIVMYFLGEKKLKSTLLPAANNDSLLAAFLPSLPFSKKQFVNRYHIVVDPFFPRPGRYAVRRIPKLIIESDNDPLVEKTLREQLKANYPDAKVYTFHHQGHFPYINAARTYNAVLRDFFEKDPEQSEIEHVISNYFSGRKQADIAMLRRVFAPDAQLFMVMEGKKLRIPLNDYLRKVSEDGKQQPQTRIVDGSVTGNTAVFTTEFKYPDKTYRDYLTLLKTSEGWKIQTKTFTLIP